MFGLAINTAFPGHAQAQQNGRLCAPHIVTIAESRPGEANEPRHLIRRAIAALKAGKAIRKQTETVLKAQALLLLAGLRAKAIGGWSSSKTYDPLPDFQELLAVAQARLRQGRGDAALVHEFLEAIRGCIHDFREASPAQRMGIA